MKNKGCSFCGSPTHNSLTCYQKRKKDHHVIKQRAPLRRESKAHASKRAILYNTFFANNPADSYGGYTCYLQISKDCPKWISRENVTLEHILPKASGKYPEVQWNVINIKPACEACNKAKMSNTPYHLALLWPHVKLMIESAEWKEWERQILPYLNRPLPDLA